MTCFGSCGAGLQPPTRSAGTPRPERSIEPGSKASTRSCTSPARASAEAAGPNSEGEGPRQPGTRDDVAREHPRLAGHAPRGPRQRFRGRFYGNGGDEFLTEESPTGRRLPRRRRRRWETAAAPAEEAGIRVVRIRSGIVLSRHGGALGKLLLPFKLGLGGRFGSGRQYWSWISIHDEVAAILHADRVPII